MIGDLFVSIDGAPVKLGRICRRLSCGSKGDEQSFLSASANPGSDARSTAVVTILIFWFNLGATLTQRNAFSASYSSNKGGRAL
jgi:hypothetical protein